jgi:hypothetical protein
MAGFADVAEAECAPLAKEKAVKLIHLFKLEARVDSPVDIGKGLAGTRQIYTVTGGEFEGERLRGSVLPGGGEWLLMGENGVAQPDVRITFQTHDGAHIYVRYTGILEFNEAVGSALAEGRATEFGDTDFLTQVRFECGDPRYEWLSRIIAVGEGRMHPGHVEYAVYQVAHG